MKAKFIACDFLVLLEGCHIRRCTVSIRYKYTLVRNNFLKCNKIKIFFKKTTKNNKKKQHGFMILSMEWVSFIPQSPYLVISNKDCNLGNQTPHLMLLMKRLRTKALIINMNVTYRTPKPLNSFIILEAN